QQIAGTTRPWIYASGYRGIRSVKLRLDQQQPIISQTSKQPVISQTSKQPVKANGVLQDDEWPKSQGRLLPVHNRQNLGAPNRQLIDPAGWQTEWFVKHEPEHLCVAFLLPNK